MANIEQYAVLDGSPNFGQDTFATIQDSSFRTGKLWVTRSPGFSIARIFGSGEKVLPIWTMSGNPTASAASLPGPEP